jgi:hypothetical protein
MKTKLASGPAMLEPALRPTSPTEQAAGEPAQVALVPKNPAQFIESENGTAGKTLW